MEAMKSGVPIIAVPLVNDQPVNARVLENVGAGLEVVKMNMAEFKEESWQKQLNKSWERKLEKL